MVDASPPSILAVRPLPAGRLALGRRRQGLGAVIAFLVHGAIVVVLFWKGAQLMMPGGGGTGPRGGGGGGAQAAHFFLLAGASPPAAVAIPTVVVVATHIPLPDPVKVEVPKVETPPTTTSTAVASTALSNGTTGGPGEGSGTLGGKGTGAGTGAGSDVGPGTGGNASYIFSASPRLTILPPTCFHGRTHARFSVSADGRVTDVELTPPPKDADCRENMLKQLRDNLFLPARTRDGQPVASIFPMDFAR
jgi:periplasmic protein TonB